MYILHFLRANPYEVFIGVETEILPAVPGLGAVLDKFSASSLPAGAPSPQLRSFITALLTTQPPKDDPKGKLPADESGESFGHKILSAHNYRDICGDWGNFGGEIWVSRMLLATARVCLVARDGSATTDIDGMTVTKAGIVEACHLSQMMELVSTAFDSAKDAVSSPTKGHGSKKSTKVRFFLLLLACFCTITRP